MARASRLRAVGCAALTLAVASVLASGCGEKEAPPEGPKITTLTIYSSLPLRGESAERSGSIVKGEKLALLRQGPSIKGLKITYKSLDDAVSDEGWNPKQVALGARQVSQDRTSIAYLGDFDSGASAISIPVLNEVGVLQVSPASTAVGLTQSKGAEKGEPDKYYPATRRTFGRVVPADDVQADAQAIVQRRRGCTRTFLLASGDSYSDGLSALVGAAVRKEGVTIAGSKRVDTTADSFHDLAQEIAVAGADCVFFSGGERADAARLFNQLHHELPLARLFASNLLAAPGFTSRLGAGAARRTSVTTPTLPRSAYPVAGQRFYRDYERTFGTSPDPYAIFGYEAMSVVLQSIKNAGENGDDRNAVIEAFFRIKDRDSVLGRYSIDDNGDTTLSRYGAGRVSGGRLVVDEVIETAG